MCQGAVISVFPEEAGVGQREHYPVAVRQYHIAIQGNSPAWLPHQRNKDLKDHPKKNTFSTPPNIISFIIRYGL